MDGPSRRSSTCSSESMSSSENISGNGEIVYGQRTETPDIDDLDVDIADAEIKSFLATAPKLGPEFFDTALRELAEMAEDDPPELTENTALLACLPNFTLDDLQASEQGLKKFAVNSLEEDDSDIIKTASDAGPLLTDMQAKQRNAPAKNPLAQKLLQECVKISIEADAFAAKPKKQEQALEKVRRSLESHWQLLKDLDSNVPRSTNVSGSDSSSGESAGKTQVWIVQETLGAFEMANHVIRHRSSVPTEKNLSEVSEAVDNLRYVLGRLAKDKAMPPDLRKRATAELEMKLNEIREIQFALEDYTSPGHKKKLIEERLLYVESACEIFVSLKRDATKRAKGGTQAIKAFDHEADEFLRRLRARRDVLRGCLVDPDKAKTGSCEAGFLSALRKKDISAFEDITLDENLPESKLMAAVVDTFLLHHPRADFRSGKELLQQMKRYVLNQQRDWKLISSELMVPLETDPSHVDKPDKEALAGFAKVSTTTTPAGHVLNAPGLKIVSNGSAIGKDDLADYRKEDPSDKTKTITTGFNSHSTTEHKHGVNVAHSKISVADKTLFAGTRHGTLSPYEMYADTLARMPEAALQQIFEDMTRDIDSVTQICTSDESAAKVRSALTPVLKLTELDELWKKETENLKAADFIQRAKTDENFCKLMRRRAAANRAREVFLTEALSNPELLKRIQKDDRIAFTSLSLITPDPFRHFLGKLFPQKFRMHDELTMRREEVQAWKDLQQAIDKGQIEIDGKTVKAEIISLSVGVNKLSLGKTLGTFGRWLLSGWNQVAEENSENFTKLVGDPAKPESGGAMGAHIQESLTAKARLDAAILKNADELDATEKDIADLRADPKLHEPERQALMKSLLEYQNLLLKTERDLKVKVRSIEQHLDELKELRDQLTEMWGSGAYRRAGAHPYKFAARLARLAFLIGSGVAYNCKSGKDRTAQLDLEAKLLSVQSEYRRSGSRQQTAGVGSAKDHGIVPPYRERDYLEKRQIQAFIFHDKTRTAMQQLNTGVEGSKLNWWAELYASFLTDDDEDEDTFIGEQFRGLSSGVAS